MNKILEDEMIDDPNETISLTAEAIRRRVDFLLAEARSDSPTSDHALRYTLRSVSNYYSVGFDAGSSKLKQHIKWMSEKALARKAEIEARTKSASERARLFSAETINEHSYELNRLWAYIKERKGNMSHGDVADLFLRHP